VPARKFPDFQCVIVEEAVLHTKEIEGKTAATHVEEIS